MRSRVLSSVVPMLRFKYVPQLVVASISLLSVVLKTALLRSKVKKPSKNWTFLIHIHYEEYLLDIERLLKRGVEAEQIVISTTSQRVESWAQSRAIKTLLVESEHANFPLFLRNESVGHDARLLVHLHSKRSPQLGFLGRIWGKVLWFIITDFSTLEVIDKRFEFGNSNIFFVHLNRFFREWFEEWEPWNFWASLLPEGHKVPDRSPRLFPAGGMFVLSGHGFSQASQLFRYLSMIPVTPTESSATHAHFFERAVATQGVESVGSVVVADFFNLTDLPTAGCERKGAIGEAESDTR